MPASGLHHPGDLHTFFPRFVGGSSRLLPHISSRAIMCRLLPLPLVAVLLLACSCQGGRPFARPSSLRIGIDGRDTGGIANVDASRPRELNGFPTTNDLTESVFKSAIIPFSLVMNENTRSAIRPMIFLMGEDALVFTKRLVDMMQYIRYSFIAVISDTLNGLSWKHITKAIHVAIAREARIIREQATRMVKGIKDMVLECLEGDGAPIELEPKVLSFDNRLLYGGRRMTSHSPSIDDMPVVPPSYDAHERNTTSSPPPPTPPSSPSPPPPPPTRWFPRRDPTNNTTPRASKDLVVIALAPLAIDVLMRGIIKNEDGENDKVNVVREPYPLCSTGNNGEDDDEHDMMSKTLVV